MHIHIGAHLILNHKSTSEYPHRPSATFLNEYNFR